MIYLPPHPYTFISEVILKTKMLGKMHIKTATRSYCIPIRMAKTWNTGNTKCWWGCGTVEALIHCWWEHKMVQLRWKTIWRFLLKLNVLLQSSSCSPSYLPKVLGRTCHIETCTWIFMASLLILFQT